MKTIRVNTEFFRYRGIRFTYVILTFSQFINEFKNE